MANLQEKCACDGCAEDLVMAVLKILESDAQVCTQNSSIIEFIFIA